MAEAGNLGNQVFQYIALRSVVAPGERLVLLGFRQLRDTFTGIVATFGPQPQGLLWHLMAADESAMRSRLRYLPGMGLVTETDSGLPLRESNAPVAIAPPAWFQTGSFLDSEAMSSLALRPGLQAEAATVLKQQGLDPRNLAFLSIRGGDYRIWPSDAPAILPAEWYHVRMNELRSMHPGITFVAMGDDHEYVRHVTEDQPDIMHFSGSPGVQLAVMESCAHGISSASTFAYWAAFLSYRNSGGTFLAPRFWVGHPTGEWYPPNIESSFLVYR